MSGKEILSLDEFTTALRRPRPDRIHGLVRTESNADRQWPAPIEPVVATSEQPNEATTEASKALRQMKRARMKGANHFVNVNLDRETKRRLKLASFNTEASMQAIMEKAIRHYLDANGH
jgi:hypothetical protein